MTRAMIVASFTLGVACAPARAGAPDARPAPTAAPASAGEQPPAATAPAGVSGVKEPIQRSKDRLRWIEGPPTVPGSRMTTLEGNHREAGAIYTIRLYVPKGRELAPHHHPHDERVTVLEGAVSVGFGETLDKSKGTRFKAGDFYVNPAGAPHYLWFEEDTVLQMTGVGPWEVIPVK